MGDGKERTLIVVRRTQADPKVIWAGGTPQPSFATLRTWMAPSNAERVTSRRVDFLELENIVRVCGGCEEQVTRGSEPCPMKMDGRSFHFVAAALDRFLKPRRAQPDSTARFVVCVRFSFELFITISQISPLRPYRLAFDVNTGHDYHSHLAFSYSLLRRGVNLMMKDGRPPRMAKVNDNPSTDKNRVPPSAAPATRC